MERNSAPGLSIKHVPPSNKTFHDNHQGPSYANVSYLVSTHEINSFFTMVLSALFLGNGFHSFADEEVVVLFGLVGPSLVGRMPSDAVFVDPPTVGRMPFEPANRLL